MAEKAESRQLGQDVGIIAGHQQGQSRVDPRGAQRGDNQHRLVLAVAVTALQCVDGGMGNDGILAKVDPRVSDVPSDSVENGGDEIRSFGPGRPRYAFDVLL